MNQHDKLLSFLKSGKNITDRQAEGLFGIKSLGARVQELREEGHCIYTNTLKSGVTGYRMGRPARRMVAAAYNTAGASVFA